MQKRPKKVQVVEKVQALDPLSELERAAGLDRPPALRIVQVARIARPSAWVKQWCVRGRGWARMEKRLVYALSRPSAGARLG